MPPHDPSDAAGLDVLEDIRARLGDLPERLAASLKEGRQTRFSGSSETASAPSSFGKQWQASEGFLGAVGNFVPGLSELAGTTRDLRAVGESWQALAAAFSDLGVSKAPLDVVSATPVAPSAPVGDVPIAATPETFGAHPLSWTPSEPPDIPTVQPQGFEPSEGDWCRHLAPNDSQADEMLAEFRRSMSALRREASIPFAPEWTPSTPPPAAELPEPYQLAPEEWHAQPSMPPAELGPPRKVPEGWADVQPLMPLSQRHGWEGLATPDREATRLLGDAGDEGREDTELLRRAVDLLEAIAGQGTERDTGQLPPATESSPAREALTAGVTSSSAGSSSESHAGDGLVKHLAREAMMAAGKRALAAMMG